MNRFPHALRVIAIVTATAIFGMILGGVFGYVADGRRRAGED